MPRSTQLPLPVAALAALLAVALAATAASMLHSARPSAPLTIRPAPLPLELFDATAAGQRTLMMGWLDNTPMAGPSRPPHIEQAFIPRSYARPFGPTPAAIVMHGTGSGLPGSEFQSLGQLRRFFARQEYASAHYGVDRRGRILQMVPDNRAAYHVATPGWNRISIGIELLNDNTGSQPFTKPQLAATRDLVRHLGTLHGIPVEAVVRHRDVQPHDRRDPPDNFPWHSFVQSLAR